MKGLSYLQGNLAVVLIGIGGEGDDERVVGGSRVREDALRRRKAVELKEERRGSVRASDGKRSRDVRRAFANPSK